MLKKKQLCLVGLAVSLGGVSNAHATLLGPLQTYPDITLSQAYLIYDHDALKTYKSGACSSNTTTNACIGQFTLVAMASTLNSGPTPAPTATQMYGNSTTDTTPDKMLTIAIQSSGPSSSIGNFVNNSYSASSNEVTITPGNTAYNPDTFSWMGDVTNFGYLTNGTQFDGFWKMTSDTYSNLPAGMSQFVDGVLTSAMASFDGGFNISNSAGFGSVSFANALKRDWVFGSGVTNSTVKAMLAPYLAGLSSTSCGTSTTKTNCVSYVNSTVMADVFVPIPPALWLWAGALASLAPSVRRITNNNNFLRSA